jgi:hypothetical protein
MNLDDYNQIVSDLAKLPSLPPGDAWRRSKP